MVTIFLDSPVAEEARGVAQCGQKRNESGLDAPQPGQTIGTDPSVRASRPDRQAPIAGAWPERPGSKVVGA
jgi:hypothetical protein